MGNGGPTAEEFDALAELLIGEMKAQGVVGNIAHDRDNQRLINEAADPISLAGLLPLYRRAPEEERAGIVKRYVAAHLRGRITIESWAEARTRVLPKIRPELENVCWPLRSRLEGWPLPSVATGEVTEHLRVQFIWEMEDATATVHAENVERWGVSLDALQDAAGRNLVKRTPAPPAWRTIPDSPGVFRSQWCDGLDATRIVLSGNLGIPSNGPAVAIAVGDSRLFLADSTDEDALFHLGLAVQRELQKSQEMVWLWPLLLDGEDRRHWLPDESSVAFAPLSVCAALHAQTVYNQHGALLQRVLDYEGSNVRVGEVGLMQNDAGAAATAVVWEAGAPAAVAHCDAVQFRREGEVLGTVAWHRVQEVVGDLLEEVPGYPTRFRAFDFPEPWQLAELLPPTHLPE